MWSSVNTLDVIILRKTEGLRAGTKGNVGLLPNSWSLCRGTLSVMSSSSKRSSTVHGSAKTVKQKDIHTGNMNIVKVELCWLASAVTLSTKGNIKRQFLTSLSNTNISQHFNSTCPAHSLPLM